MCDNPLKKEDLIDGSEMGGCVMRKKPLCSVYGIGKQLALLEGQIIGNGGRRMWMVEWSTWGMFEGGFKYVCLFNCF